MTEVAAILVGALAGALITGVFAFIVGEYLRRRQERFFVKLLERQQTFEKQVLEQQQVFTLKVEQDRAANDQKRDQALTMAIQGALGHLGNILRQNSLNERNHLALLQGKAASDSRQLERDRANNFYR